jgi:hypothetical protein
MASTGKRGVWTVRAERRFGRWIEIVLACIVMVEAVHLSGLTRTIYAKSQVERIVQGETHGVRVLTALIHEIEDAYTECDRKSASLEKLLVSLACPKLNNVFIIEKKVAYLGVLEMPLFMQLLHIIGGAGAVATTAVLVKAASILALLIVVIGLLACVANEKECRKNIKFIIDRAMHLWDSLMRIALEQMGWRLDHITQLGVKLEETVQQMWRTISARLQKGESPALLLQQIKERVHREGLEFRNNERVPLRPVPNKLNPTSENPSFYPNFYPNLCLFLGDKSKYKLYCDARHRIQKLSLPGQGVQANQSSGSEKQRNRTGTEEKELSEKISKVNDVLAHGEQCVQDVRHVISHSKSASFTNNADASLGIDNPAQFAKRTGKKFASISKRIGAISNDVRGSKTSTTTLKEQYFLIIIEDVTNELAVDVALVCFVAQSILKKAISTKISKGAFDLTTYLMQSLNNTSNGLVRILDKIRNNDGAIAQQCKNTARNLRSLIMNQQKIVQNQFAPLVRNGGDEEKRTYERMINKTIENIMLFQSQFKELRQQCKDVL